MSTPPPEENSLADSSFDKTLRVPIGPDSQRWRTTQFDRCVLFIVRMATNFVRLIDIAENLLADYRIQCVFTICDGRSAFGWNLERTIIEKGCVFIPWEQARRQQFDLAITASLHDPLEEVNAPILMLSHGPGHTKTISIPSEFDVHWNALIKQSNRKVILALVSEEEKNLFPDNLATEVIGDCVFDSMYLNRNKRPIIRDCMNLGRRKLVTLSSTWGSASSYARYPRFAADLVASLPADKFVVASILHPNIWSGHSPWQIKTWYGNAIDSGLILVPYDMSWQSVLLASDCFIGDHGSVSMYANMLGIPSRQLSFDTDGEIGGLPIVSQTSSVIPIETVEEAVLFASTSHENTHIGEKELRRSFANLGASAQKLQSVIYRLIDLDLPRQPAMQAFRLKDAPSYWAPTSFYVASSEATGGTVTIQLYPAATGRNRASSDSLLISSTQEKNAAILDNCKAVILANPSLDYAWRCFCPNAHAAFLRNANGTFSLENRNGGHIYTVESDSENTVAVCGAAITAIDSSRNNVLFTCGFETRRVIIRS